MNFFLANYLELSLVVSIFASVINNDRDLVPVTTVSQGPVVINSGSTIVKASEGVTITKDFEVKNGAEFMIIIE